ncbi:hypothetical protein [Microbacterium trichothecenolyticum]|uniref:hypothetical protein n=1 Tax=Microbacterium trichothecenolyticum TaxID=69370 RepID=UPI0012ECC263|nr:hypothetical protein [Microbacterium trichothecenolyticum]
MPAGAWAQLAPWDRYLARVHAALLQHPGLIPTHESAAALYGAAVFGDPLVVHALAASRTSSRLVGGIRWHTTTDERELAEIGGFTVSSLAECAVDLARARHPAIGLAVADSALRLDSALDRAGVERLNEARASTRGRRLARWPLSRATSSSETPFESVSRAVIEWLGYPAPELQRTSMSSSGIEDRADFAWPIESVLAEADGDLKYDGRFGDPRTLLRRQAARDTRLREQWRVVVHWGWTEATTISPLRGILRGAGLRPCAPENAAALLSLKRAIASRAPHPTSPTPDA